MSYLAMILLLYALTYGYRPARMVPRIQEEQR